MYFIAIVSCLLEWDRRFYDVQLGLKWAQVWDKGATIFLSVNGHAQISFPSHSLLTPTLLSNLTPWFWQSDLYTGFHMLSPLEMLEIWVFHYKIFWWPRGNIFCVECSISIRLHIKRGMGSNSIGQLISHDMLLLKLRKTPQPKTIRPCIASHIQSILHYSTHVSYLFCKHRKTFRT